MSWVARKKWDFRLYGKFPQKDGNDFLTTSGIMFVMGGERKRRKWGISGESIFEKMKLVVLSKYLINVNFIYFLFPPNFNAA